MTVDATAYDTPGVWCHDGDAAAFALPMAHPTWEYLWCGIDARIGRCAHWRERPYYLDAHATRPDHWRDQTGLVERYATRDAAMAAAEAWLVTARAFCAAVVPALPCPCCGDYTRHGAVCEDCARGVRVRCAACRARQRAARGEVTP